MPINVHVYEPDINISAPSYTPNDALIDDQFQAVLSALSYTTSATGWWTEATLTPVIGIKDLEDWMIYGLGRHIEIFTSSLTRRWAGFVNGLSITFGSVSLEIGPLIEVANRALAFYTNIDTSVSPPLTGPSTQTIISNDANSQAKFGIWDKSINAGTVLAVNATQARDMFLTERRYPSPGQSTGGGGLSITINCLGYWSFFQAYPYSYVAASGTRTITQKMGDVLGQDPNGIFNTSTSRIATNATLSARYDDSQNTAQDVIKQMTSVGDSSNNRYVVGVDDGQTLFYEQADDDIIYEQSIYGDEVYDYNTGAIIEPFNVLPARWLFYSDLAPGQPLASSVEERQDDPRYEFIESITYTLVNDLSHTGAKISDLQLALARWGLDGTAA